MQKKSFDKLIESIRRKATKRGGWVQAPGIADRLL